MNTMFAPLTGRRIIDVTQVLAGPYCTYQPGLLGAEVIKVELLSPPPRLGEHTEAVLRELGMTEDDILALRHTGVMASKTL